MRENEDGFSKVAEEDVESAGELDASDWLWEDGNGGGDADEWGNEFEWVVLIIISCSMN